MYEHCGECNNCIHCDFVGYNNFEKAQYGLFCEKVKVITQIYPKEPPSKLDKLQQIMVNYDYLKNIKSTTPMPKTTKKYVLEPTTDEDGSTDKVVVYCVICSNPCLNPTTGEDGCTCKR